MRLKNLYFWLFFFSPLLILGQVVNDAYVTAENVKASSFNREGKFEEAENVLNDLLRNLESQKASEKYFSTTYQTKAKVIQNLGRYEESSLIARKSLVLSLKSKDSFNIADSYNTIGVNHYFLSDYDSTSFYYEKSFEIKKRIKTDEYALAVSAYNLAIVFEDLGQMEKALKSYKDAEGHLLRSEIKKNFLSDVYVGLAHINFYSGDVEKAEEYAEKAIDVGIESYGEFNPNMTFVYVSYANILESQKKYSESIALLEKSLSIRLSTYGERHRWTCEAHYDLANSYFLNGEYVKAEILYKKSMKIGEEIKSTRYLANARVYLARLYLKQELHLDKAEDLLVQALDKNIEIYGSKNEIVADNHYYLADLQRIRKNEKRFFNDIENTLKASNYNSDSIQNLMAPFQALDALVLIGDWYKERFEETAKLEYLEKSFKLLDREVEIITYSQENFSSDRSRINLASEYHEVFEKGLNLCWQLYHNTKDPIYLEKAFELSEANRNTTLLKGLQDVKFKQFSKIPPAYLYIEHQIKEELERVKMNLYYEKTASNPDKENYSLLLNRRINLSNKLDSIHDSFSLNYPKYHDLKHDEKTVVLSHVQEHLEENTQLITYFLGKNHLYSFTVTNDSIRFLRGEVSRKLVKKANSFVKKLSNRESLDVLGQDLYLLLLGQQIDESKKNIIIVADDVLNYLPFEILRKSSGDYLIEDHCVSYQGSSQLFLELKSDFFDYNLPQTWAGFSPFYENEKVLSSSSGEIEEISELVGGVQFIGDRATKTNFLKNNRNFSVLHLAMHAEVNHNNPQDNKLLFADGELTASEIYLSNSMANMAILSACNTGFGKIEKGEGVMSMARAFHFSGIPSVVMSLWKIPDKETKSIMINFYRHLKRGIAKNEALRLAKLDFIKSTTEKELLHPYYWSGFVVNGDTSPIIMGKRDSYSLWIAIIVLALAIVGYQLKKAS